MLEKSYYSATCKYYEQRATNTTAWELKFTRTDRLAFNALAVHQEEKLLKATAALSYKIPDSGMGQKPMDGVTLVRATAVVVAIFYKPKQTEIYEIDIRKWIVEAYSSKDKSLTRLRASEIGTRLHI